MLKPTAILLGVLLLVAIVTAVVDMDQTADAMKATKKSPRNSHAHYKGNQVCGDELCPGSPYTKKIR